MRLRRFNQALRLGIFLACSGAWAQMPLQAYPAQPAAEAQPSISSSFSDAGSLPAQAPARIVSPPNPNAVPPNALPNQVVERIEPPRAGAELPNEFQKFVLEATGKLLPRYGARFFEAKNGYAPRLGTPVPADYPLGPGDEVIVRGWGSVDVDYRGVIDRDGQINIPKVGTVQLAGVRAANAEDVIRTAFGRVFRGVNLNVTLGQLRGVTIYVVGQAWRPGTYVVSGMATAISALFESGGPNATGSLRHVQVKRGGKLVAELDLYAFLAHGDKSADVRLLDGDTLVIPPAYGFVALTGKVETPAIYELRGPDDTVESVIDVAGGLPVTADPRRALLERIDPERRQPRSVDAFALDADGLKRTLKRGDLVTVLQITPDFANAVVLQGSVFQALRVPYRAGMKITDLIPNKEFLLSRAAVRRQNYSIIAHDRRDEATEREQFPIERQALDEMEKAARARPANQGASFVDSIGNKFDEINWDYAVVERLNRAELSESLVPFNLGRALADPQGPDNVLLQPGDTVSIFSADNVRAPIARRKVFVRVEGEVRRPGVYQAEPGESLINIVERAGGPTPDAYLFGSEFYRESVRKAQQENLDKFVRRLEQQGTSDAARLAANVSSADPQAASLIQTKLAAETESRNRFLQRLRELKSTGRITLGLPTKDSNLAQVPTFRLENGDRLVLPSRPDFVQVVGSVNTEAALLWQPARSVSDYLKQAGVTKDSDRDNVFVIRADGTIASNSDRWLTGVGGEEALPGDVIVVPEKLDKETFWTAFMRNAKDVTQVLANFGLGAAAVHTLSK